MLKLVKGIQKEMTSANENNQCGEQPHDFIRIRRMHIKHTIHDYGQAQ